MYDKLKAHGAEILKQGFNIPMEDIEALIGSSNNSIEEFSFMTNEYVEILVALNSWTSYISVAFSTRLGLSPDDKITSALNMAMMQIVAVVFVAGHHAGKIRTPVTEDEVQALFEKKE